MVKTEKIAYKSILYFLRATLLQFWGKCAKV